MNNVKTTFASIAICTAALCTGGAAYAGSLTQPGETVGIALGAPLPEGVYFVDTASVGDWRALGAGNSTLGVNIPVIAWSTPWMFLGGRIEAYAAVPEITVSGPGTGGVASTVMYNPALLVGEAWDLGGGWGFSNFIGGYAPSDASISGLGQALDFWTFNERAALSYTGGGWNLTAHIIYGSEGDNLATKAKDVDYFNYDLTAVKTFGKWQAGLVAFGSADVGNCGPACQSQFAMGGLAGYSFPGISVQLYGTRDVAESKYAGEETRVWTRVVVPLWSPAAGSLK